jgi:ABC-type transport system involved in multi-copper enzyme maturation permease subunit
VCVVAGDAVAGEAAAGTLRYLLVRPVGRTRLLVAKFVGVLAFTLVSVVAVALVSYVAGSQLLGTVPRTLGGTTVSVSGTALSPEELLWRTVLVMAYVTVSMVGVASLALLLLVLPAATFDAVVPVLILAALALVVALERPALWSAVCFLLALGLAYETRAQAIAILPAALAAPVLLALLVAWQQFSWRPRRARRIKAAVLVPAPPADE